MCYRQACICLIKDVRQKMNFDDTKSLGKITEADLSSYESEIGGRLPEGYRAICYSIMALYR